MKFPIYLDYMATTPVDPKVQEVMLECLGKEGVFGNPASRTHCYGWEADQRIREAQEQVALLINADPREIVWTSGATESDNLALKGAAHFYQRKGKHIITMSTEHKAVLDTCRHLATEGFEITYLNPEPDGLLSLDTLRAAMRPETILVSIMHVNNETGVIQDIAAFAEIAHQMGAVFHSDAAQSAGKLPIDVRAMGIDLMSFSGHKIYGPKGVGVLFVSRSPRVRLEAQMHGGSHQHGLRSGTLPTHQIVGMGKAFQIARECLESENERIMQLRDFLWQEISTLPNIDLNGHLQKRVAGCLNICIEHVDGEVLLSSLPDIAVSSGSACNSVNPEPSHVLRAMGLSRDAANRSIRISIGRFTTQSELETALIHIKTQINHLKQQPSLWDSARDRVKKSE